MRYYTYILRSLKDEGLYVGMISNLEKRLEYHNKGRVRSTKSRIPFKIIYAESYALRSDAREREKYLKSYAGSREKMLIAEKSS